MGFASEMSINDANKNEAKEAIKLIEKVQLNLIENEYDFGQIEMLEDAIRKIQKYSERFQPEIQRYK